MRRVKIQKLATTNGFIVIDLPDADLAAGPTRLAPKILQDGAEWLARSVTYTFASFGLKHSGASAGINAKPDERDTAITAYMEEVAPMVAEGRWLTWPSTGVTSDDLAALRTNGATPLDDPTLTAAGAVAATAAMLDGSGLAGADVVVVGSGPVVDAARTALADAGADVVDGGLDQPCTAVFVAGKSGVVDHHVATNIQAKVVSPLTPLAVTAKAYAALRRADATYVPDFIALAGPLLAALDGDNGDPVTRIRDLATALATEGPGAWLAACGLAEAFLQTWRDELPFGRPI
jgi:glutamate dehydrogenase/leucine dehydrogenase